MEKNVKQNFLFKVLVYLMFSSLATELNPEEDLDDATSDVTQLSLDDDANSTIYCECILDIFKTSKLSLVYK